MEVQLRVARKYAGSVSTPEVWVHRKCEYEWHMGTPEVEVHWKREYAGSVSTSSAPRRTKSTLSVEPNGVVKAGSWHAYMFAQKSDFRDFMISLETTISTNIALIGTNQVDSSPFRELVKDRMGYRKVEMEDNCSEGSNISKKFENF